MARSNPTIFGTRRRAGIAVTGTLGMLLAGMTAVAPTAGASPAGTIILASGPSGTPSALSVLGASSSYVLFDEGTTYPRALRTVPTAGGTAVTLSSAFEQDNEPRLVGSLVSADGYDNANNVNAIDYEQADGTGTGSVDVPNGYHSIYSAGSADGGYVWSRNAADKTIEIADLTTSGAVTDLATLPGSAHSKIRAATSDESGLLVAYQDSNCDVLAEDIVFVPAAGGPATTLITHAGNPGLGIPPNCAVQYTSEGSLDLGGGEAVWDWYDASTETQFVDYASTSGGTLHSLIPPDDIAWWWPKVSGTQLAFFDGDDKLRTYPIAGGGPTTSTFPAHYNSGFASTGSSFAFVEFDGPSDAGIYTATSAASTPTKIFTDGVDPLAATDIDVAPGQVGYEDNAMPAKPIFTRSLTRSGNTLTAGTESLVANNATGFGLSLSGTRAAYLDDPQSDVTALELKTPNAGIRTLRTTSDDPDLHTDVYSPALSGRRVLYPVATFTNNAVVQSNQLFDDVTGQTTTVSSTPSAALWGNYLVTLDSQSGAIIRKDLSTGQTTPIYTIPHASGDTMFGNLEAWGNTVAWSVFVCGTDCNDTPVSGYLTVAPGSSPGAPTSVPASSAPVLSSGYIAYLADIPDPTLIALPLSGGSPINVTTTPCANSRSDAYSLDASTVGWLDCASNVDASSGTPEVAPLPHVANPPWFLGDPQAPTAYATGLGSTWDSDFVTSAALTSCNVVISQGATTFRTLPCNAANMALGEATASWDGKNSGGTTVSGGIYTWTLQASNADGSLLNYDGSATPVTGTIQVSARVPDAPTGVTATAASGQAAVSWIAPADNGGSPITGYDVEYSSNGGSTWTSGSSAFHTSTATSQIVNGLTNGGSYLFRVAAINAIGTGAYSAPSAPITVGTVPGAPTNVTVTTGSTSATVSWTAPSDPGSSPITGYDVQFSADGGTTWTSGSAAFHTSSATSQTITGLTNGTQYMFRVAAINAVGTGPYSTASASVAPTTPATLPAAPTGVTATGGPDSATVTWTAPTDTGGSPITSYVVQDSLNGGTTWNSAATGARPAGSHDTPATTRAITGLVDGTTYVFRVAAVNGAGTGAYSTASAPVTPEAEVSTLSISGPHHLNYGQHLRLTTSLIDTTKATPISGAQVELLARHGGGSWSVVRTATTDSFGISRALVSPTRNTRYEWRFAGDATHGLTTSLVQTVTVRQVVTAHLTDHHAFRGGGVEIYGTVGPRAIGRVVYLQRWAHGRWHTVGVHGRITRRVMPNGTHTTGYILSVTPHRTGHLHYRVYRPATSHNGAGSSRAVTVRVT